MSAYGWGFTLSYAAATGIMLLILFRRLWLMARRLSVWPDNNRRTFRFFASQIPLTIAISIWSGFLFGTGLGCLVAACIWLFGW